MVHRSTETSPTKDPRGSDNSTIPSTDLLKNVNCERRHPARMTTFTDDFDKLQTAIDELKPLIASINEEISTLMKVTSSDEISSSDATISNSLFEAETIVNDYRDITASIQSRITTMTDEEEKSREQQQLDNKTSSSDGPSGLPLDSVGLSNLITKLDEKFKRALDKTRARILNQLRFQSNLVPPNTVPSTSIHDDSNSIVVSTPSMAASSSDDSIQSLKEKVTSLEYQLSTRTESTSSHHPNLALPTIKLETFDGSNITLWPAYKYQLDMMILNQPHLNEVEKAFYVRSSLRGAAFNLVSSIPTNKDFLRRIIDRLELEYNRHDLTQATLLESLLKIHSKSSKLHDQIDAVRSMINVAQTIDESCGLNGLLTQQLIAERIHTRFIPILWRRKQETLIGALHLIEETLRVELEDARMIDAISKGASHQKSVAASSHSGVEANRNSKQSSSSPSFHSAKVSKPPMCLFCGKHSYSADCTQVVSPKDRKEILRKKSVCFGCLSDKHTTNDCQRKCSICSGKHHKALCEKSTTLSANTVVKSSQQPERLFTASVVVSNPNIDIPHAPQIACIHLDHGSQVSLISRKLVNKLSLVPIDRREMTIAGINGEPTSSSMYDIVNVVISTTRGMVPIEAVVREVSSVNTIHTQPLSGEDLQVIQSTLGTVPERFSKPSVLHTDILLSVGDTLDLLENSKDTKLPCGYRLVESSIGPIVVGSNKLRSKQLDPMVSALTVHNEESLEQKIERLFSVDPAARVYETTEKEARKVANELVSKHFDDTIEKRDDEYFVQYSVKPEAKTDLPSNYDLAASRLSSTIKTLSKQRSNLEYYDSIINDQLSLGQIEKVDLNDNEGIIHYLPHQPVLRPDKPTTPLRIVYDASAHLQNKPSLNDMIHPGPSDLEQIPAILLRARSRSTLIVSDVEKAFLQVKLHPSQRNMLRFLWLKDLDKPVTRQNILVLRFCVTPFGVNASPSLLNKVIHHHIQLCGGECHPDLIHQLVSNLYVDNVIINIDRPHPIMYSQSKHLFDTMSMNLRDYASNDSEFMCSIPESDRSKDEVQKLLGLLWNVKTDKLCVKIPMSDKDGKVSKRTMLSAASSPYDPLGLLNPLLLPPRLTIQNLWNTSAKWDEPVDDSTRETFHEQMRDLEKFNLSIDRYAHLSDSNEITLVAFSDASKLAMAACVYSYSPHASPTLLISKTRLAPIKSTSTIPKMELDSLVMAHSLIRFTVEALRKEFPEKRIHVYTYSDSAVVLHWCKPEFTKPVGVFVANRVKKIHDTRDDISSFNPVTYHQPRHVRSEDNPADHATRGLNANAMNDPTHQWWTGPEWLKSDPNSWPNEDLSSLHYQPMEQFPMVASATTRPSIETVIDLRRHSTLRKAISVTAYVFRFMSRCASRVRNPIIHEKLKHLPSSDESNLTSTERRFAFNSLIRLHQLKNIPMDDPLLKTDRIIEDPIGLLRQNSRLTNANLRSETKSPVYIPTSADSTLARLIISEIHHSSSHSNIEVILNQAKHKYWMPRCRQIAKSVLRHCVPCRKTNNFPFRYPATPELPQGRVRQSRPFEHCGLDYAGPFHSSTDEKMYVAVFTCFSTRLSHLEVVSSLLPSALLFAFRRFCSRRGTPSHVTSDQATTFKLSSTVFTNPDDDPNMNTFMSTKGINWNFTTAHAPWKGGIYERLIKIIKESLTRSIGRKKLSQEEFTTVICEVEALLNSRPLTYVSSDDINSFHGPVLRPIDLICPDSFLGCSISLSETDGDYVPPAEENSSREAALKQLKRSIDTVDAFWKRWHSEYLTTLRDCSSRVNALHSSRSTTQHPMRGSLVLIVDESGNTPRSSWKMGKILSLTETSATLRSHAGRVIERPLNLLIPLEIHSNEDEANPVEVETLSNDLPDYDEGDEHETKTPATTASAKKKKASDNPKMISKLIKNIVDSLTPVIIENVTQAVSQIIAAEVGDAITILVKESVATRTSVSDLKSTIVNSVNRSPSTLHPNSFSTHLSTPTHRGYTDQDYRVVPSTSRTSIRTRSPVSNRKERSRSRTPIRSYTNSFHHKNVPQCALCKSTLHLSKNCDAVRSVKARLSITRSEGRCRKCFRVLDSTHFPTCEPPLCSRHCTNSKGELERHADYFCPKNPSLDP